MRSYVGDVQRNLKTDIPDLRDLTLEQLAELSHSGLTQSVALYRERMKETHILVSAFQAKIA